VAINPLTGQFVPDQPILQQAPGIMVNALGQAAGQPAPIQQPLAPAAPPTGLIGSELALRQGLGGAAEALRGGTLAARGDIRQGTAGALGTLGQAGEQIGQQIGLGVQGLQGFADPGVQAQQAQAALSGALGPEAQAQAFAQFQESPGQAFLRQQGEQAVLRNASAIGGLGSGNVRLELQRRGIGQAAQNFQQQFQNLGAVTGTGLQAAGQVGQLRGQQAGLTSGLGQAGAGVQAQAGANLANIAQQAGGSVANLIAGTGQQLATGRTRAGEQIAGAIGSTTSGLSTLLSQQGAGISDITGAGGSNLANLLATFGQQTGASQEQLAAILANLSVQQASQTAGLPAIGQFVQPNTTGAQLGQLASGIGTALANRPAPVPITTGQFAQPLTTINTGQQFGGFA